MELEHDVYIRYWISFARRRGKQFCHENRGYSPCELSSRNAGIFGGLAAASVFKDNGETGRSAILVGENTAAAAGECGSEAGGESRARLPEERWNRLNGLSFWTERIGATG